MFLINDNMQKYISNYLVGAVFWTGIENSPAKLTDRLNNKWSCLSILSTLHALQELSEVFMKTLEYTRRFSKFKNRDMIASVRQLLQQVGRYESKELDRELK